MARRRGSARRRRRGGSGFLYKLLSVFLICGCLVAAITLFFRVDTVVITGEKRYTEAEIRQASGVGDGDNLFLLNKYPEHRRGPALYRDRKHPYSAEAAGHPADPGAGVRRSSGLDTGRDSMADESCRKDRGADGYRRRIPHR